VKEPLLKNRKLREGLKSKLGKALAYLIEVGVTPLQFKKKTWIKRVAILKDKS
jgi:hypothetical protein